MSEDTIELLRRIKALEKRFEDLEATEFLLNVSGKYGMGTANPAYPLQVRRAGGGGSLGIDIDNIITSRDVIYYSIGDAANVTTGHVFYTRNSTATDVLRLGIDNLGNILIIGGNLVLPKTSGLGIKVDTTAPTFGWQDLLGDVFARNTGGSKPAFTTYRDTLLDYQFGVGDEEYFKFHIPHDYVAGTDIFLHFHWSHTATTVTGGTVTFEYEASYAKGHNQAVFPASVSGTITGTPSTTQYQQIISETQLSASSPSGSQIDSDDLEPDGVIMMRGGLNANNLTVSSGGAPAPFIHYVDIHYQSTNIGTKDKVPNFYT